MRPVLVALQGDPTEDAPVDYEAVELARRAGGGLVVVRVVGLADRRVPRGLGPLSLLGPHRLMPEGGDTRLEAAARAAADAGISVETELIASSDPAGAIADVARRRDAALVLVEAPGPGRIARMRGKHLARRVRRLSHAPVFTVGRAPVPGPERSR